MGRNLVKNPLTFCNIEDLLEFRGPPSPPRPLKAERYKHPIVFKKLFGLARYKAAVQTAVSTPSLKRTPSGLWMARKVIPEDVRAACGKREEKPTWPGSLSETPAVAAGATGRTGVLPGLARPPPPLRATHRTSINCTPIPKMRHGDHRTRCGDLDADRSGVDATNACVGDPRPTGRMRPSRRRRNTPHTCAQPTRPDIGSR